MSIRTAGGFAAGEGIRNAFLIRSILEKFLPHHSAFFKLLGEKAERATRGASNILHDPIHSPFHRVSRVRAMFEFAGSEIKNPKERVVHTHRFSEKFNRLMFLKEMHGILERFYTVASSIILKFPRESYPNTEPFKTIENWKSFKTRNFAGLIPEQSHSVNFWLDAITETFTKERSSIVRHRSNLKKKLRRTRRINYENR